MRVWSLCGTYQWRRLLPTSSPRGGSPRPSARRRVGKYYLRHGIGRAKVREEVGGFRESSAATSVAREPRGSSARALPETGVELSRPRGRARHGAEGL